ncbi:MAG: T9SS type A sorting domain-containing protein [Saprospiraceae bacterium]|nr:T9SS type A sorting domain-containing protein [Saprospiraceae bacterium]MBK7736270.1 T9SS type A sorting domain-containing protein [Saprospiraceae bacterium]MBK7912364.1 T9SS type A sorting domain-containing protein [Saprospiraceae bacterium]
MRFIFLISLLIFIHINLNGASYFVSNTVKLTGDGSMLNPWTLQKAFDHPSALKPGDTVWIRGGIYTNDYDAQTSFNCKTNGTLNAPIIFKNYNGERVLIDGAKSYTIFAGLGNCSYTWFWGLEVINSSATDRNHDILGGITCTAENIKFINMIVHDTGSGIDAWKTAKNTEIYGCIIYHIGNNLLNGTNWEGHGHGMYLQNDTFGTKLIHNNIVFNTFGNGIKIWQTTTTAPIGNFDIRNNILFNGGSASENLGGVGNNSRTHNFFVLSNGPNNPLVNTVIKHNYTFAGLNSPRPPVNAFGLNYGVKNLILDSNYLTCQTRLGFNNTPIFNASIQGNRFIGGIPSVYGYYLWGFAQTDFPENQYIPEIPSSGLEYFILPNKYEPEKSHLVIYNWDSLETVQINCNQTGLKPGDSYDLINVMDYQADVIPGQFPADGILKIPMIQHSYAKPIGSTQAVASQFPVFGVFIIRKNESQFPNILSDGVKKSTIQIFPNPSNGKFKIIGKEQIDTYTLYDNKGNQAYSEKVVSSASTIDLDFSNLPKGIYFLKVQTKNYISTNKLIILD